MSNKNSLILVVFVGVLAGIVLHAKWQGDGLNENNIQEDCFLKKKECASYKEKIEKELDSGDVSVSVDRVFYSPLYNTCMYAKSVFFENTKQGDFIDYSIKDYFTGESKYSKLYELGDNKEENEKMREIYEDKIFEFEK
jgi:hypothetical protein